MNENDIINPKILKDISHFFFFITVDSLDTAKPKGANVIIIFFLKMQPILNPVKGEKSITKILNLEEMILNNMFKLNLKKTVLIHLFVIYIKKIKE